MQSLWEASGASRRLFYVVATAPVFENSTAFDKRRDLDLRRLAGGVRGKSSSVPFYVDRPLSTSSK